MVGSARDVVGDDGIQRLAELVGRPRGVKYESIAVDQKTKLGLRDGRAECRNHQLCIDRLMVYVATRSRIAANSSKNYYVGLSRFLFHFLLIPLLYKFCNSNRIIELFLGECVFMSHPVSTTTNLVYSPLSEAKTND